MMRNFTYLTFLLCSFGISAQVLTEFDEQSGYIYGPANCLATGPAAIWIGGAKGLVRFDPFNDKKEYFSGRPTSRPVLSLAEAGTHLWAGIQEKGLYLFDKKSYQFKGYFKNELGTSDVVLLKSITDGLLVLTKEGVAYQISFPDSTIAVADPSLRTDLQEQLRLSEDKVTFQNLSFIFSGGQLLKQNEAGEKVVIGNVQVGSYNGKFTFLQDKLLWLMSEGLLLYDSKLDSIPFPVAEKGVAKERRNLADQKSAAVEEKEKEKEKEKEEVEGKKNHEQSSEKETKISSRSNEEGTWWMMGFLMILFSGILVWLRRKYKRDIETLEEEIVRLKKEKA